jgi:hypothetical protein
MGPILYSLVVYLVLTLGSLVAPGLSATSINGDRAAGVLATLQTTLLTPAEIVLGKLAAAWFTSLAFWAVSLPFVAWGFLRGGTSAGRLVVTTLLLMVMLLVVCAVGLGWSALAARTAASVVLTYLTVAFLSVFLPLLFLLSLPLVTVTEKGPRHQLQYVDEPVTSGPNSFQPVMTCIEVAGEVEVLRSEWTWWLLAPNPYVVLGDASPRPAGSSTDDALTAVRTGTRLARLGQLGFEQNCDHVGQTFTDAELAARSRRQQDSLPPAWPYGLVLNLALGAGFTVTAVRRLRAPARALPRGTRVA